MALGAWLVQGVAGTCPVGHARGALSMNSYLSGKPCLSTAMCHRATWSSPSSQQAAAGCTHWLCCVPDQGLTGGKLSLWSQRHISHGMSFHVAGYCEWPSGLQRLRSLPPMLLEVQTHVWSRVTEFMSQRHCSTPTCHATYGTTRNVHYLRLQESAQMDVVCPM